MAAPRRPFDIHISLPLTGHTRLTYISEERTSAFIWRELRFLAEVPEAGQSLFAGSIAERRRYWREFAGYIRQAEAYFSAASRLIDSSAALLYYYCFLNLAKAELLIANPSDIWNKSIRHGLSFSPAKATKLRTDQLTVTAGIFPLLYKKRTTQPMGLGTTLPIRRVIEQCSDVGWELEKVGLESRSRPVLHLSVSDRSRVWSVIALANPQSASPTDVTRKLLHQHLREIEDDPELKRLFGFPPRFLTPRHTYFEAKETTPVQLNDKGHVLTSACMDAARNLRSRLRLVLDDSLNEYSDAILSPSLYKSRMVGMPISLARYAAMFYVSSLVRYKPSHLDRFQQREQAWLLDAFTPQAAIPMVHDFMNAISGQLFVFVPLVGLRTG